MADVTQDEIIKLVREYGAFKQMYGYGASPNERQNHHRNAEAKLEEIIAALTRPAPSQSDGELLHQFQLAGCRIAAESPVTEEATDEYCVLRDKVLARMRGAAVPEWRTIDSAPKGEVIQLRFGNGEVLPGWWTGGSFVAGYEPGWLAVCPELGYQAFKCTMPEAWAPLLAAAPKVKR